MSKDTEKILYLIKIVIVERTKYKKNYNLFIHNNIIYVLYFNYYIVIIKIFLCTNKCVIDKKINNKTKA